MGIIWTETKPEIALLLKIFTGWYFAFGVGAFFPATNEPFFTRSPKTWDILHCYMLNFAGLYTLQCTIWTLTSAYYYPSRVSAMSMAAQLLLVVGIVTWIQITGNLFSPLGLAAFSIDACFGLLFAYFAIA
ncbi:unnamed protein product [Adineta ricciae]|uniref:Uncharacterized protein n=1 Tax=Adineta ricciae TaxID=249248 RepID=A0A814TPR9_ADIRI|nr:unnamed protein product [Adineta ricciae]CAF1177035.1 unnamed protein product [Adineta ricciae]